MTKSKICSDGRFNYFIDFESRFLMNHCFDAAIIIAELFYCFIAVVGAIMKFSLFNVSIGFIG